jgi:hypothetical protein
VEITSPGKVEIRNLEVGRPFLTNRSYLITRIPQELSGMKFTAVPGNAHQDFQAKIAKGSTVYLALDSEKNNAPAAGAMNGYSRALAKDGWKHFGTIPVSDKRMENMRILVKTFSEDSTVDFKGLGFIGSVLIAPALEIKGR